MSSHLFLSLPLCFLACFQRSPAPMLLNGINSSFKAELDCHLLCEVFSLCLGPSATQYYGTVIGCYVSGVPLEGHGSSVGGVLVT